jgi:hypothetical protein
MAATTNRCPTCSHRGILKASALGVIPLAVSSTIYALHDQQPMTANVNTDLCPILWLEKDGSDIQPAGPTL